MTVEADVEDSAALATRPDAGVSVDVALGYVRLLMSGAMRSVRSTMLRASHGLQQTSSATRLFSRLTCLKETHPDRQAASASMTGPRGRGLNTTSTASFGVRFAPLTPFIPTACNAFAVGEEWSLMRNIW